MPSAKLPPPEAPPEPDVDRGLDDEPAPAGLVEDDPSEVVDEAQMLAEARRRQRQENPELVAVTDRIAAKLRKKD